MADKDFKVKAGIDLGNPLAVAEGGTGQTTANNALNALLPVQTSANGQYLKSDGTSTLWSDPFYQQIKNNGTAVTARKFLNLIGGTFADDAGSNTTTVTFAIPTSYDGGGAFTVYTGGINGGNAI